MKNFATDFEELGTAEPENPAPTPEQSKGGIEIPADVFPVPSGDAGYEPSGDRIFPVVAKENAWFLRDNAVFEIIQTEGGSALTPLTVERAVTGLERMATNTGHRIARRELKTAEDGKISIVWRAAIMPQNHMELLMQSDKAREYLPSIRQVFACPVLVPDGANGAALLGRGYHTNGGGTFIAGTAIVPDVPLYSAVDSLIKIHADTSFCSEPDRARAIAFAISPALRAGGWINDDFPLHVAEATESQSGKDYLQKIHCAIYGEVSSGIAPSRGGVGSVDESLSRALIAGRPFICLSNFRGKLESAILESAIRGQGRVDCRALRTAATVDCSTFNWQLSTNGAEFTRDLANRSIVTRLRKQPASYPFKQYPEGDVLAHITGNQAYYLGCVYAVIRAWASRGRPATNESRHDFRGWCRAMDWIVTEIFDAPPLLDGHQEQQARVANPALQWLRDVAVAVIQAGRSGDTLTALDLADVCEESDIALPGRPEATEEPKFKIGRTMRKLFADAEFVTVDGSTATRRKSWDSTLRRDTFSYVFARCCACAPDTDKNHETLH